jgi:deaminated glutathione amidase
MHRPEPEGNLAYLRIFHRACCGTPRGVACLLRNFVGMTMLAAVQMVSTPDVPENLDAAARLIAAAAGVGASVVCLPEYFCQMPRADADRAAIAERFGAGVIQSFLSTTAQQHGIWLIGGTVPLLHDDGRVRNASCVYRPDGMVVARYDKLHLFSYDNGTEAYDEAAFLSPGESTVVVAVDSIRTGLSVCYDLRFPELYRAMTFAEGQAPLDLITAPSAFTHTTGSQHWELLVRTRAVENQCYVLAAAQGGTHATGRRTWGQSMIVDPWGVILASVETGEGIAVAQLDRARIAQVRAQLPALYHRRL